MNHQIDNKDDIINKLEIERVKFNQDQQDLQNKMEKMKSRNYELEQITDNFGEIIDHKPINFTLFKKKSLEFEEYLFNNSNTLKTFKDHHLFIYKKHQSFPIRVLFIFFPQP